MQSNQCSPNKDSTVGQGSQDMKGCNTKSSYKVTAKMKGTKLVDLLF